MKLKLDENLSRQLKPALALVGYDVATAAEESLLGQPDTDVAWAAKTEGRILFTLDVEFGDLRKYPPGSHPGFVLFRPRSLGSVTVIEFVKQFASGFDLSQIDGCVVVVEPLRVRVRCPRSRRSGSEL